MIFDDNRDELGRYIRHMADLMGLSDWTIVLSDDHPPSMRTATTAPAPNAGVPTSVASTFRDVRVVVRS